MNKLSSAIAIIKNTYVNKLNFCFVRKNKLVLNLVTSLYNLGFIRGFTILNKVLIVHMQYTRTKLGLRRIALFSRASNKVYLNKKQIRGRAVHGFYKTNGAILFCTSSSKNFLTQWECASLGIGGLPVIVVG